MIKASRAGHARWQNRPNQPPLSRPSVVRHQSSKLWYAIYLPSPPESLDEVAESCLSISDYVSINGIDTLLAEVRSSLRYFGGIKPMARHLAAQLPARPYYQAVSPSPSASLLLARHQQQIFVRQAPDLRSALGNFNISALPISLGIQRALARCGLLTLRDLWRIPPAELRLRFGRPLHDYLQTLIGKQQELPPRWSLKKQFNASRTFDDGLAASQQITAQAGSLIDELAEYLNKHHLQCGQFTFTLHCEMPPALQVPVTMRHASRDKVLFRSLFELALDNINLTTPVSSLTLRADNLQACQLNRTAATLPDLLAARLGNQQVLKLLAQHEYAPEFAARTAAWHIDHTPDSAPSGKLEYMPFPSLLVQPPLPLREHDNKIYYQSVLAIVRGPYRIETQWWAGKSIRRDYYVARNQPGSQLWIFKDLDQSRKWYLQGLFA
jgi:protein ImuB